LEIAFFSFLHGTGYHETHTHALQEKNEDKLKWILIHFFKFCYFLYFTMLAIDLLDCDPKIFVSTP
jgi:hypothetical protein